MSTVNIHIDRLIENLKVSSDRTHHVIANDITDAITRAVAMGAELGADNAKEEVHESKIEIIERFYSKKEEEKKIAFTSRVERIVLIDGEEVYRQCDKRLRNPRTRLDEFIDWLLMGCKPEKSCNGSKIG